MKKTLFVHIPKTAGTSVLDYLREVYQTGSRLELRNQDNTLPHVTAEEVAQADFIWLHEPLSCLPYYDHSEFFRFTFLREPLDRIQSLYAYLHDPIVFENQDLRFTPEAHVDSLKQILVMSFEEFVCSDNRYHRDYVRDIYSNYFCPIPSIPGETCQRGTVQQCLPPVHAGQF